MKGKAKLTRELSHARREVRETETATVVYEVIELNQRAEHVPTTICTNDNVAYGHVSLKGSN